MAIEEEFDMDPVTRQRYRVRQGFMKAEIYQSGPVDAMVKLDGMNVADSIRGFTVVGEAGCLPTLVLDPVLVDVSIELDKPQVYISAPTRHLLIELGWIPPEPGYRRVVDLTKRR